jgi:hypothetical protein
MSVPSAILELVERFEANLDAYRSGNYNETRLRREFVDPFFEALGWDVQNRQGYAEAYKDVIHEDSIRVGGATKAPDYCFCIGGARKFFLEAKKPSVNIKTDTHPAYQLRRYAWSAKLPVSILTDFEEFAVYDCRTRPVLSDKASQGRILYLTYREYAARWDEMADIFARDAILKGSFDKFADSAKGRRGTAEVDDEFLKEIEDWRDILARHIALRNPQLSMRELNFAVQRTIDRLVFLRICEDRGIEPYGRLAALRGGENVYRRLYELFQRADERYNSGLFHFRPERGRAEAPDDLSYGLTLDDAVLKGILNRMYYPESPYEFSVLPADILGQVYERFLGKVIRLTAGHQAKIEEKPEVRKAGGVYYTPTYIVDYIVRNTVGKLLEGRTPKQAAALRVLDPACGSGSFLLGAYEVLLGWHRDWYIQDGPEKHAKGRNPALVQRRGGDWRLTTAERKRILLNNLYGVDIDPQAVEVTKLSLLLKVLEGESEESLSQLMLFHERALPDLGGNIKCGNSLIGPDFYQGRQLELFDREDTLRLNAFDWQAEFPETMARGGFDAVIGNQPYVLLQTLDQRPVFDYLAKRYRAAKYKIDTYQLFIEKGLALAALNGNVGFITPATFLRNKHARALRAVILDASEVDVLRVFYYPVFAGASVDTSVLIASKRQMPNPAHRVQVIRSAARTEAVNPLEQQQTQWTTHPTHDFGLPGTAGSDDLVAKMTSASCLLGEFATAYFGIQTFDRSLHVRPLAEATHFRAAVDGGNIRRYHLLPSTEFVDFRPEAIKSGGRPSVYEQDRVGTRQIGEVPIATLLPAGIYTLNTIYNIFFTKATEYALLFVLGILSSKALGWYWRQSFFDQKGTFPKIKKDALLSVPIPRLDFADPADRSQHDCLVALVQQMLDLNRQVAAVRTPHERTALERQIEATDREIDRLVYELYGLSADGIRLVEESGSDVLTRRNHE